MSVNRGIGATFRVKDGTKYTVERDAIINIKAKSGERDIEYNNVRLISMNRTNDAVRVVMAGGGINEIPTATITSVKDSDEHRPYSRVSSTSSR